MEKITPDLVIGELNKIKTTLSEMREHVVQRTLTYAGVASGPPQQDLLPNKNVDKNTLLIYGKVEATIKSNINKVKIK